MDDVFKFKVFTNSKNKQLCVNLSRRNLKRKGEYRIPKFVKIDKKDMEF